MNFKLSHLLILSAGVVFVFLLGLLPKFVVSDKEKRIKTAEKEVKKKIAMAVGQSKEHNESSSLNLDKVNKLKGLLKNENNSEAKRLIVDSLVTQYKNAFLMDSALTIYVENADINPFYYTFAMRDGITGLRMSQSKDRQRYFLDLCENTFNSGIKKFPEMKELKVEKARLRVFSAALSGEIPMAGIADLKNLLEETPDLIAARIALAEFMTTVQKVDEAVTEYSKVLEYDPDNLQANVELVNLYLSQNQKGLARQHVEEIQRINKINPDPFISDFINKSLKKLN